MSTAAAPRRTGVAARRRAGPVAVVLSLALLTVACTTDADPAPGPTPSPPATPGVGSSPARSGVAVGLVLAPGDDLGPHADDVRDAVAGLTERGDVDVTRARVLEAPDEDVRRDELMFLADDGVSVVCTVGRDGVAAVLELAPRYPTTTFCVLGAAVGNPPDNVISVTWRDEELAFLAGAAAVAAGEEAEGATPREGPPAIGLVAVGDVAVADAERLRTAFDAGAEHVRPGVRVRPDGRPGVSGDDLEAAARAAAERLFGLDVPARVVVPFGGADAARGVREAAAASGGLVVGLGVDVSDPEGDTGGEAVVASVVPRYDVALAAVVRTVAEPPEGPVVVGVADEAVRVAAGNSALAGAVVLRIRALLRDMAAGAIEVPDPATRRTDRR